MKNLIILFLTFSFLNLTSQDTIVHWNFNNQNLIAKIGPYNGTLKTIGHTNSGWAQGVSNNVNDRAWMISSFPSQSSAFSSGTAGIEIRVDSRGYEDLILCFDQWADSDASRWVQIDYSPDGGICWHLADWTNKGQLSPHGQFYSFSINLSTIVEANNNEDFRIRITSIFSPFPFYEGPSVSYDANSAYMRANANSVYQDQLQPTFNNGSYNPNAAWRFDNITIKGISIAPLSVNLINFVVEPKKNMNLVSFKTAKEVNNDYFEILRSHDGISFKSLDRLNGKGSSEIVNYYNYEDSELEFPIYFYKIKQIDFDGQYEYSHVLKVENKSLDYYSRIFPSIVSDRVEIINEWDNYTIEITDMSGRHIQKHENLHGRSSIDVSTLSNGTYILKIVRGEYSELFKIIKP